MNAPLSAIARQTHSARVVRAPRGTALTCKSWTIEAAYRMLQNNLDPEVAERPDDLVVYGGIGRAARNWECFDQILAALRNLNEDESLLIQSGKAGRCVSHAPGCTARADRQLESGTALGELGALRRAGPQGFDDVRADDRGLVDLHRLARHRPGYLRDVLRGRSPALRRRAFRKVDSHLWIGWHGWGATARRRARRCLRVGRRVSGRPHRFSAAHALPRQEGHRAR